MNVLRADLKDERDVVLFTESSRLFHNIGAEKEKARSQYVTDFPEGVLKCSLEDRGLHNEDASLNSELNVSMKKDTNVPQIQ